MHNSMQVIKDVERLNYKFTYGYKAEYTLATKSTVSATRD